MPSIRMLVPEETINYIKNPCIGRDTTGYLASGSVLARTLTRAKAGIASMSVVTSGVSLREGFYYRVNDLAGVDDVITISAYVRGKGTVRIRLIDNPIGKEWVSDEISLNDSRWQRIEATGRCTGSNDMRLYVETSGLSPQAVTFYADAMQMERKTAATTYCDGNQPGCRWNIIANNSYSSRSPYTRAGGRWIDLNKDFGENIYVTSMGGFGMASLSNNTQPYSLIPGAFFHSSKTDSRVVTIMFNVIDPNNPQPTQLSLSVLHNLRQKLIEIFKPDKTGNNEDFTIEYDNDVFPVYLKMRYDSGLEGEWDIRNVWVNSFPVRFIATSPMIYEDSQETASLKISEDLGRIGFYASRIDGTWNNMNYGSDAPAFGGQTFAFGKNKELYVLMGAIANANVKALFPNTIVNYVAMWNGQYFQALTSGLTNGGIRAIAVAPNGDLYAVGSFTTIGGVAANCVAKWNGTTWSALGTGLNSYATCIFISNNGSVYVAGNFTTAGGIVAKYIARWDGSAWYSMGNLKGFNNIVSALAGADDGSIIYAGGIFTTEFGGGITLNRIAAYDPETNLFSALGSGFNNFVSDIELSKTNVLYVGGNFTASGSTPVSYIAQWNKSAWLPVGVGFDNVVYNIDTDNNGNIIAAGGFSSSGSVIAKNLALWNGSIWSAFDINVTEGSPSILAGVAISDNDDIYIAGSGGTDANATKVSGITLVNNTGTAEVEPVIYITGQGTLRWLENQSTGKKIYADLYIFTGEEIYINIATGKVTSTIRGNLSYGILPGSDFRSFKLVPGTNKIACFIQGDVGATANILYVPTHWSMDSTGGVDKV